MKRALLLATTLATFPVAIGQAAISDADAVHAIIGEAGNQSDTAMLAVASALRNRGTLQGVYGVNNAVNAHASAAVRARAQNAWFLSAQRNDGQADPSLGCKFFGCPADAPYFLHTLHFRPVKTIGQITFYKP
jgi:hypothetical protein